MSQEEVIKGLNKFCIPRRNSNIKCLCKETREVGQGKEYHHHSQEGLSIQILCKEYRLNSNKWSYETLDCLCLQAGRVVGFFLLEVYSHYVVVWHRV